MFSNLFNQSNLWLAIILQCIELADYLRQFKN